MKKTLFAGLILATCIPITPQVNAKTNSVDTVEIAKNIHLMRLNSTMSNTSSVLWVGPDGVLLIDPNFDGSEKFIREKIRALGGNKIDFVTSTHVHQDHTEQYPNFLAEAVGIVPEQQRKELAPEAYMQGKLPTITFQGSTKLHLNGDTVTLSTLPTTVGHTNGDLIAYFDKAKVLYVGDYLFINGYPIVDRDIGDLEGYLKNIKHLLQSYDKDVKVLAGHTTFEGDFGAISMEQYQQYYDDLVDSIKHIKTQMKQGKTTEQIIDQGLPKRFSYLSPKPTFVKESRWIENIVKYYSEPSKH